MDNQTTPAAPAVPVVKDRLSPGKLLKWGIALVALLTAIGFGVHYWRLSQQFVSTDNAYLNANRVEIAAQVSGPVTAVWIQDQQSVKLGELLVQLDAEPYQLAVDSAEAQLELAYQASSHCTTPSRLNNARSSSHVKN